MSGDTAGSADPGPSSFETALSELERDGCNVLVVGAVPEDATAAACRQLFGEPGPDQRRLLVHARGGDLDVRRRLETGPAGPTPGRFEVVRDAIASRHAATPSEPRAFETRVTSDQLSELGRTVSDRLLRFEQEGDAHTPIDVRVCFDSLSELFAQYETEPVFRFVNMMAGQIRNVGGFGQFHLPVPKETEQVALLAGLFDAVVELRMVDGGYEQRWHLEDGAVVSDWQPL